MATIVVFEEQVEVPLDLRSLADFRRWALSDAFPQRGRIDYIGGRIEEELTFRIHHRGESGYEPVEADGEGFQRSEVFGCGFRLDGRRDEQGNWKFDLLERVE